MKKNKNITPKEDNKLYKGTKISPNRQFRRRLANKKGTLFDLREVLPKLNAAYEDAVKLFIEEVKLTPPQARGRGFEASLLNTKINQCVQKYFPHNWEFGRYKRFILNIGGYIILFKKLDKRNLPMNIKTGNVEAISQQLSLPLFGNSTYVQEPIIFFGYQKDSLGRLSAPKIVYLDDGRLQWAITAQEMQTTLPASKSFKKLTEASPRLKNVIKGKKKSS